METVSQWVVWMDFRLQQRVLNCVKLRPKMRSLVDVISLMKSFVSLKGEVLSNSTVGAYCYQETQRRYQVVVTPRLLLIETD